MCGDPVSVAFTITDYRVKVWILKIEKQALTFLILLPPLVEDWVQHRGLFFLSVSCHRVVLEDWWSKQQFKEQVLGL